MDKSKKTMVFEDGKATSVTRTNGNADVDMGINEFSHLIIGNGDTKALEFMDHVMVHQNTETLGQVFYRKPNRILEYF